MNRDVAVGLLDRLHTAQNEFYAGGSGTALQQILAPDLTWTIPGNAGTYRGLAEVLGFPIAGRLGPAAESLDWPPGSCIFGV